MSCFLKHVGSGSQRLSDFQTYVVRNVQNIFQFLFKCWISEDSGEKPLLGKNSQSHFLKLNILRLTCEFTLEISHLFVKNVDRVFWKPEETYQDDNNNIVDA